MKDLLLYISIPLLMVTLVVLLGNFFSDNYVEVRPRKVRFMYIKG